MVNISTKAIEALKSDTRFIKAHLDIYFDEAPTRLDNYFMSIDTSEQTNSGDTPFGNVIYNELTVTLDNIDGTFLRTNTNSSYYNKLLSGIKVVVSYEVEVEEDIFESIKGGTFYTADWKANTSDSTASLVCYDLLFKYNTEKPILTRPCKNIAYREAFEILFKAAGIPTTDYTLDDNLTGYMPLYWSSGKRFSEELSNLALATCCNVWVNKNNKIVVKSLNTSIDPVLTISDDDLIMSIKDEDAYTSAYDGIKLSYSKIGKLSTDTVYSEDIAVNSGTQILANLALNKCPVTDIVSIIIIGASTVSIVEYDYDSTGATVTLANTGDTCTAKLVIIGEVIAGDSTVYTKQSNTAVKNNVLELTLPFAQDEEYIKRYTSNVLSLYSQYTNSIEVEIRALPMLEVNDKINIYSNVAQVNNTYVITGIDSTFENGLVGKITATKSVNTLSKSYACIGPGMYIELEGN